VELLAIPYISRHTVRSIGRNNIKPKRNRVFYSQINKYMHFRITLYVAYAIVICEDIFKTYDIGEF
jgi:hypothetical protein